MTFTVNALRQCSGGNHVEIDFTIGGVQRTRHFTRDQLITDIADVSVEEQVIVRLRSAVKEATTGNPTALQIRNALVGNTFEV